MNRVTTDDTSMRRRILIQVLTWFLATAGISAAAEESGYVFEEYTSWDKNVVDTFRSLPVLEEGRVKPLDTFAQLRMLRTHG